MVPRSGRWRLDVLLIQVTDLFVRQGFMEAFGGCLFGRMRVAGAREPLPGLRMPVPHRSVHARQHPPEPLRVASQRKPPAVSNDLAFGRRRDVCYQLGVFHSKLSFTTDKQRSKLRAATDIL
jgi:hypothetical protein